MGSIQKVTKEYGKPLFEIRSTINKEEYKKLSRSTLDESISRAQYSMYALFAVAGGILLLSGGTFSNLGTMILVCGLGMAIMSYVNSEQKLGQIYDSQVKSGENVNRYLFYKDYMLKKNKNGSKEIAYKDMTQLLETGDTIGLMEMKCFAAMIGKENCSQDQLQFIRETIPAENRRQAEEERIRNRRSVRIRNGVIAAAIALITVLAILL